MTEPLGKLGAYQLEDELGHGAMGVVYKATDLRFGSQVAIKVISPHLAADSSYIARFRREAHVASLLTSPYVVRTIEFGSEKGQYFLVAELVSGQTLRDRLESGPLAPAEALGIAADVALALDAAGTRGIVHRDIKPENIMLCDEGIAKLMDFGVAQLTYAQGMTMPGYFIGSALYAAPEQFQGQVDARSDIYSLGVVLFEMLAGQPPFRAKTLGAVVRLHEEAAPPLEELALQHPAIVKLITRSLAKSAGERFQTPMALITAIEAAKLALQRDPSGAQSAPSKASGQDATVVYTPQRVEQPDATVVSPPQGLPVQVPSARSQSSSMPAPPVDQMPAPAYAAYQQVAARPAAAPATPRPGLTRRPLLMAGFVGGLAVAVIAAVLLLGHGGGGSAKSLIAAGTSAYNAKRYDQGLADLNNAISLDPNSAPAYDQRGQIYVAQQKNDLALADYNKALQLDANFAPAYRDRGLLAYNDGRYDDANADFNKAVQEDPTYALGYNDLGIVAVSQGRFDDALVDYNKALQLDPNLVKAYHNRGLMYADQKQPDLALADYDKALQLDPKSAITYVYRGNLSFAAKKFDDAITDYNRAIQADPTYVRAYTARGYDYAQQGKTDQAKADNNKALQLDPNFGPAYTDLGILAAGAKNTDEALADFNKSISVDPAYGMAYMDRGVIEYDEKRYDDALTDYNKALQLDAGNSLAYLNRGRVYAAQSKNDQAFGDYNKSIDLDPSNFAAYYSRGNLNRLTNNPTAARADLQKALSLAQTPEQTMQAQSALNLLPK